VGQSGLFYELLKKGNEMRRKATITVLTLGLSIGCGTTTTFPGWPNTTYIRISELGCAAQDVNLNTGLTSAGGTATDDGPCINAALSNATAQRPIVLIQDGASLTTGIFGPAAGNWGIVGLGGGITDAGVIQGTGFFQKAGTNNDVIHNGIPSAMDPSDPQTAAPTRGWNIAFKDFVINGNRGDGTNGNSTTGDPRGSLTTWYMGINVANMNNVYVDGVYFYNTSAFNFRCSNCGHVTVTRSHFEAVLPNTPVIIGQTAGQTDGVHIDGPSNDILISDSYFHTGDDSVALNAPEGYCGPITRVTISNSTFHQSISGGRIYSAGNVCRSGAVPTVDRVTLTNYGGDARGEALVIGAGMPHALNIPHSITNVTWTNSVVTASTGIWMDDSIGTLTLDNVKLQSLTSGAVLDAMWNHIPIEQLKIRDVSLVRTPTGNTAEAGLFEGTFNGSAVIDNLDINGFKIEDEGGPYANLKALIEMAGAPPSSIVTLKYANVDFSKLSALSDGGAITTIIRGP
jgi:Glycosyl hydrolases family 28